MPILCLPSLVRRGLVCLTAVSLLSGSAWGQKVVAGMTVPVLPGSAVEEGTLPSAQTVTLMVYLAPPAARLTALDSFLTAVQTPGSPQYHRWLTPAGFAQSFGATGDQVAAVQAWAAQQGLTVGGVSASRTSVTLTGGAAQVETALAAGLHVVQVNGQRYVANAAVPSLPEAVAAQVLAIDGLSTVPSANAPTLRTEESRLPADDLLAGVSAAVEENSTRLLSIASAACVEDVDAATRAAMHLLLKEAAAEGITVLASSGCNGRGSASYPASGADVMSVAVAPGITPAQARTLTELRPAWQQATGLPQDGLRHEPDLTVSSLPALESTVLAILAKSAMEPAAADEPTSGGARLGNIAGKLYTMASAPGLYTQPDNAAAGTWEAATGLGLTNLQALTKFFPYGTGGVNVTILPVGGVFSTTYGAVVSYTVSISGSTVATPTGTVSIAFSPGGYTTMAPLTVTNGQATFDLSQLTGIPAANSTTYTITATYNGDTTYAGGTSSTKLYVGPQPLTITPSTVGTPPVGGTYTVNVALAGKSGAPTGTVTISPANTAAKTVNFTGVNGQASVSADFTANRQGSIYIPITCMVDSNYTCDGSNTTVYVVQGTSTVTVKISPNPVPAGQAATLSATVTGSGGVAPSGQVVFTDANNTTLCTTANSSAITGDVSCTAILPGASGTVTGTYSGDTNYAVSKGTAAYTAGKVTTKVTLETIGSPLVVNASVTLTANISPTTTLSNQPPTGTITFYDGTTILGQKTLGSYQYSASLTLTFSTAGTRSIFAKYSGDTSYDIGSSDTQSVVVGPATAVSLTASPTGNIVYGNNITLTAAFTATPNNGAATLSGSIKFNTSGTDFTTQTVNLTNATGTSATAVAPITQALSVGTYTVNLYCISTNFDCGNLNTASFSFTVVKAATTTILQLNQAAPFTAGSSLTAVAKVSPTAAATGKGAITGTVDFYDNATKVASVGVDSTGQASATFNVSGANDNIVAVYNGDGNNVDSKSTGSATGTGPVTAGLVTATTVTASPSTALNGSVATLTANVVATPASGNTTAGNPAGVVYFYDVNNGTQFLLGSATLGAAGANAASAVLVTTALRDGANTISAAFQGSNGYAASSTTVSAVVQITDFSVSFTPASLSLNAGQSGKVTAAVNAVNGFAGQVTLGCSPPSGAAITCSFDKTAINTSGLATLTVNTTIRSAAIRLERVVEAAAGAAGALLLCLLLPAARRRRLRLLSLTVLVMLGSTLGCTELSNPPTGSGLGSGTPAGTLVVTVTAQGTDATGATLRRNYTVTVNVQ